MCVIENDDFSIGLNNVSSGNAEIQEKLKTREKQKSRETATGERSFEHERKIWGSFC